MTTSRPSIGSGSSSNVSGLVRAFGKSDNHRTLDTYAYGATPRYGEEIAARVITPGPFRSIPPSLVGIANTVGNYFAEKLDKGISQAYVYQMDLRLVMVKIGPGLSSWLASLGWSGFVLLGFSYLIGPTDTSAYVVMVLLIVVGSTMIWRELVWVTFSSGTIKISRLFWVRRFQAEDLKGWRMDVQGIANNQALPLLVRKDGDSVKLESVRRLAAVDAEACRIEAAFRLVGLERLDSELG